MSRRAAPAHGTPAHVEQLQKELGQLKQAAIAANIADSATTEGAEASPNAPTFDQLSSTEKSAASLGVHPDAWKPIGFMNNAHYDQLMKTNALDDNLARRIEAYRNVASAEKA